MDHHYIYSCRDSKNSQIIEVVWIINISDKEVFTVTAEIIMSL